MAKKQRVGRGNSSNTSGKTTNRMQRTNSSNRQERVGKPANNEETTYGKDSYNANDPQWYIPNEQLLNDVAAIPYSIPLGTMVNTGLPTPDDYHGIGARGIPGVMTFNMYAGPGRSNSVPDAINVAANMIYSKIRANISGARPYDAPDMMMYLMGADHAYMYLAWMQRLYGIMNVYSSVNRYLPKALIEQQGVDFNNLRDNLSNFRYYINNYALQLASLYVPSDLPIFKRHYWLYQNVWADSESAMSQVYMYAPAGFGTYEEKTSDKGGTIKFNGGYKYGKTSKWNVGSMTVFGDALLEKLIYSEDVGTISGDIRRTYGEGHSLVPSTIDETYSVVPSYNREVLSQIENTFSMGVNFGAVDIKSLDVTQNPTTNKMKWDLSFVPKTGQYTKMIQEFYSEPDSYYLSSHGTATKPADNMVMTRFMNGSLSISDTGIEITSCGSEIVLDVALYLTDGYDDDVTYFASFMGASDLYRAIILSKFDWHPIIYVFDMKANPQGLHNYWGIFADLDTFTLIPKQQLMRLNDMACMGLFNVPYRD